MDLTVVAIVLGVVLLAELPDKSMFASLVLGTKFKPLWVFLGVATAFSVHVVIAVVAGRLLTLLPQRLVEVVVVVLFVVGAGYLWWSAGREDEEADLEAAEEEVARESAGGSRAAWTAFGTSFGVIFIGEWGDITQLLTVNLVAKYDDPLSVGVGAVLGLWAAALLAITLGQTLLRWISVALLQRIGAIVLLLLAAYTAYEALTG